jgi:hypothetical protein
VGYPDPDKDDAVTATTTPTGIAGAADHAPSRATTCYVCGSEMDSPHAMRGMPGVGVVGACSRECAGADGFRSEGERLRVELALVREMT